MLWGFVFAWHTRYSSRPVITFALEPKVVAVTTLAAVVVAALLYVFVDTPMRARAPEDFPTTPGHWLAMTLFSLVFSPLFLVFAPFAWLMRLFKNRHLAIALTVMLGMLVLALKMRTTAEPLPDGFYWSLLAVRAVMGFLAVSIYLRGGLVLALWWGLLLELRHFPI